VGICPEGWGFAVAEAYRRWVDLEEEEAMRLFKDYQARFQKTPIQPAALFFFTASKTC
jgi:hypothetical protein